MEEITIVEQSPQTVLGMRKRGVYKEIAVMLPKLFECIMSRNIPIAGPPVFVCHEKSKEEVMKAMEEGNADIEVVVPIAGSALGAGDIERYELPGGTMAKIVHKGPYEECEAAYERLFSWLRENDKCVTGPLREVYLNDPREISPGEILTEIYAPID